MWGLEGEVLCYAVQCGPGRSFHLAEVGVLRGLARRNPEISQPRDCRTEMFNLEVEQDADRMACWHWIGFCDHGRVRGNEPEVRCQREVDGIVIVGRKCDVVHSRPY